EDGALAGYVVDHAMSRSRRGICGRRVLAPVGTVPFPGLGAARIAPVEDYALPIGVVGDAGVDPAGGLMGRVLLPPGPVVGPCLPESRSPGSPAEQDDVLTRCVIGHHGETPPGRLGRGVGA